MTSDASWSTNARKITELELPDHVFLTDEDECYYFGNYSPGKSFKHSETNQTIFNLKKPMSAKGKHEWKYKTQSIDKIGKNIAANLTRALLPDVVLVPIPPSKPPSHPEFDDRIERVVNFAAPFQGANVLRTLVARDPMHNGQNQRSVESIYQSLEFVENPETLIRGVCILVDDVLTTGASFRACKQKLLELDGVNRVIGFFGARCAWEKQIFDLDL
jgi:predicted amidophosphoribosyltransferase